MAKQQAPLKVDPEVDELITSSALFLGLTKKELVADAVRAYVEQRREELRLQMQEIMQKLDGTRRARVSLLTGIPPERLDELGGVGE
jgi:Arc/MetJ family transcription regulator